MSSIKLILNDLHLADGHTILDNFGEVQQAAFEGLIAATNPAGPLGRTDEVELIINGDCFDFLATPPYNTEGVSDVPTALAKVNQIIAAHAPFFATLRQFIETPGRQITFTTGNHDIEIQFEQVRTRLVEAIGIMSDDNDATHDTGNSSLHFSPTRSYRPLPDVYIEHGNHYDFWNQAMPGLWDSNGEPLNLRPESITLPFGSHYFQHAAHPVSIKYAYFDHFEPSINSTRQIALLCLLDPEIVIETARLTSQLLSEPRPALAHLAPGDERVPARLFEQAAADFATFQLDLMARKKDWAEPGEMDAVQSQTAIMTEYFMLREALAAPLLEAIAIICTPNTYQMGEGVAAGMHHVLKQEPQLRYAIAGHTHMVRIDSVNNGTQSYLNTASWSTRLALPAPGEVTPELIAWLRNPDWQQVPLRDVTQLTFAMVNTTADGRSSASLCAWEGGTKGTYRVLA